MTRRRLAVALALVVLAALSPPVQRRWTAAATLAEALGVRFPRPLGPEVVRRPARLDGVEGDLYWPGWPAEALLVVPGASPQGRDDPRTVRAATGLARAGRTIFVPELALYRRRLEEGDVERIVTSALVLDRALPGRVAILGFSYGGSLGLVAAADPRLRGRVSVVGTFGAYWDLVGVLQAASTGVSVVDNRRLRWRPDPLVREVLSEVAADLAPPGERDLVREVLAEEGDPSGLSPEGRAAVDLVRNRDPELTASYASRLSAASRERLRRLSPSHSRPSVPVVALHSTDDPAVPYAELLRLRRDLPAARTATLTSFRHVDFAADPLAEAGDLWRAVRFTAWVLSAG